MFVNPLNFYDNINHNLIRNAMNDAGVRTLGVVKVVVGVTILVAPVLLGSTLILSGLKQVAKSADELRTWYDENCYEENSRVTAEDWQCKTTAAIIGVTSPAESLYNLFSHYFD